MRYQFDQRYQYKFSYRDTWVRQDESIGLIYQSVIKNQVDIHNPGLPYSRAYSTQLSFYAQGLVEYLFGQQTLCTRNAWFK